MPIVSRNEFADLCGDPVPKINVWIGRNKIWVLPDNKKLIDTENPVNYAFIEERLAFHAKKQIEVPSEKAPVITKIKPEKVVKSGKAVPGRPLKGHEKKIDPAEIQRKEQVIADQMALAKVRMDQDMQKKQQDMELVALKIQSEKIRLDKTAGNLLPIDLAAGVIERHANTILKTFEKGFERIGELYSNMAGFGPTEKAEFMKECRMELAQCVTAAGEKSQNEIDILVDNYSETLMTGQRKA